jgi:C1A family cysteine protease
MHEQLHCDLSKARTAARTDDPGLSVKRDRGSEKRTAPVSSTVPTAVAASAAKKTGKIVFRFTALSAVRLGVAFLLFLAMTLARAGTTNGSASGEINKQLPANVDLRPKFAVLGLGPRDQGERPTCSVFTMTVALEFANAAASQRGERLSVEYLNWAANQMRRNPRDGGFFSDMWNGFAKHGICSEEQMPYQTKFASENSPDAAATASAKARCALGLQLHWIKRWNVKTGLKEEEFNAIKNTLNQGWPVCGGFRWPNKELWKKDVLQMCPANAVYDGHSILLVGYQDDSAQAGGGAFIFRNTNRGGRDGYMPYEYAKAYMNDALWINPPDKPNAGAVNPSASSKVATQ